MKNSPLAGVQGVQYTNARTWQISLNVHGNFAMQEVSVGHLIGLAGFVKRENDHVQYFLGLDTTTNALTICWEHPHHTVKGNRLYSTYDELLTYVENITQNWKLSQGVLVMDGNIDVANNVITYPNHNRYHALLMIQDKGNNNDLFGTSYGQYVFEENNEKIGLSGNAFSSGGGVGVRLRNSFRRNTQNDIADVEPNGFSRGYVGVNVLHPNNVLVSLIKHLKFLILTNEIVISQQIDTLPEGYKIQKRMNFDKIVAKDNVFDSLELNTNKNC